jgi:tetratricopeptide (TPR) repeat protein
MAHADYQQARATFEQALMLFRQVGDVHGEARCIASLANIAMAHADYQQARATFEQALMLFRQVGDVHGEARCIAGLGDIAMAIGDHAGARAALSLNQQLLAYNPNEGWLQLLISSMRNIIDTDGTSTIEPPTPFNVKPPRKR